jgi:DNA repair protein RadC
MSSNILLTESFSSNEKRHYFLDFKKTSKDSRFLQITRSEQQVDGSYKRTFVIVFEEDFHFIISGLSSLFHHCAYLQQMDYTLKQVKSEHFPSKLGIPGWAPELKPREKLLSQGAGMLRDEELLAILLGSGTCGEDAVSLSARILGDAHGFSGLSGMDIISLQKFKGVGQAKAAVIKASIEIARRCHS